MKQTWIKVYSLGHLVGDRMMIDEGADLWMDKETAKHAIAVGAAKYGYILSPDGMIARHMGAQVGVVEFKLHGVVVDVPEEMEGETK